jgi:hypothetical protein
VKWMLYETASPTDRRDGRLLHFVQLGRADDPLAGSLGRDQDRTDPI